MKEQPIIFGASAIPLILDGTITVTHRIRNLQHINERPDDWSIDEDIIEDKLTGERISVDDKYCPYGAIGSKMWVREPFCYKIDTVTAIVSENEFWYKATNPEVIKVDGDGGQEFRRDGWAASPWLSPIHMPKRALRIILENMGSRVIRIQDITREDIRAEGIRLPPSARFTPKDKPYYSELHQEYAWFWNHTNPKYKYDLNPWVRRIEFKVVEVKDAVN